MFDEDLSPLKISKNITLKCPPPTSMTHHFSRYFILSRLGEALSHVVW
ncbi:hypothetical protein ECL_03133 [Enterobacter cloacae subsp. cloacae ATCC 13047]|uniref:Uncharacterized protein n=1 Tax=Enterobacter cloacae subsp. cloacae (strain ATCC 13047 / DSM 30054 / NBRC 13535 / NCTC 10005 / WDCM 00083 / NCDC 279-56) TaxID=716541 RepID=A0A0H3CMV7_ENTCC|nr:hypothetical protein ECL_03133 [Enterobacter cloacae subsp. cloacae ATCC 13047]